MKAKSQSIVIRPAKTVDDLESIRKLCRSFLVWHRQRHVEDIRLIDDYFDKKSFEEELSNLPGKYAPPTGCLLLALYEGLPAGCVALRPIDPTTCEMKRMFVYEQFHGKGVGKALAAAAIQQARHIGYSAIMLDTSFRQKEAMKLYQSLGFRKVAPYYQLPEKLKEWLVFMELKLDG